MSLWCRDWHAAEQTAVAYLGPRLADAEFAEVITSWWFVRKGESWRVRCLPAPGRDEQAAALLEQAMLDLAADGAVQRWAATVYEPEIHAFGGVDGIECAHDLFHADSRHLLDHLRRARRDHRRELGLLLGTALMRAAGQDLYEQGDVWARVAAHRPASPRPPLDAAVETVHRLLTAGADSPHSPLAVAPAWPAAFYHAGRRLADLAHRGGLGRGLRAVLAHHILFAWNRAGIPPGQQALLAATATRAVFHREPVRSPGPAPDVAAPHPARLNAVTTATTDTAIPDPAQLRAALADHIRRRGTFRTPRVEAAFRAVPRHLFLPGVDLQTAYAHQVVVTRRADDGTATSSASHPNLVASMLEQLDVHPGHRVLEIGAGTGINAALLAELTGPAGHVTTVDIDADVTEGARAGLTAASYPQVEVIGADGADGHAPGAPYDRIVVTAGAWDIAPAWWRQLAPAGRLVVPLRLHGSDLTRSIAFDNQADRLVSGSVQVCGFVPILGVGAHPGHSLPLADDVTLRIPPGGPEEEALRRALASPAHERWTGVVIDENQPIEHLDLWLATTAGGFARLFAGPRARENGVADPARRWAGAAIHDGGTLAYITRRDIDEDRGELGVRAHGPDDRRLAGRLAGHLATWDRLRPTQPRITAHPAGTPDDRLPPGHRVDRPSTRLTIAW